ncbi:unnamed protein product, partial [Didymodactylos carnosus]
CVIIYIHNTNEYETDYDEIDNELKQTSIWKTSASYQLPFGVVNIIFNSNISLIPSVLQIHLSNIYLTIYLNDIEKKLTYGKTDTNTIEVLIVTNDKNTHNKQIVNIAPYLGIDFGRSFSSLTLQDIFNMIQRLFHIDYEWQFLMLDGFPLKLNLNVDFDINHNLLNTDVEFKFIQTLNFNVFIRLFHGTQSIGTGFEMTNILFSNIKFIAQIASHAKEHMIFGWIPEKENILFKIERNIFPLIGDRLIKPINQKRFVNEICYQGLLSLFGMKLCGMLEYEKSSYLPTACTSLDTHKLALRGSMPLPNYLELSMPNLNYSSILNWSQCEVNQTDYIKLEFNLMKNDESVVNGSGKYVFTSDNTTKINKKNKFGLGYLLSLKTNLLSFNHQNQIRNLMKI